MSGSAAQALLDQRPTVDPEALVPTLDVHVEHQLDLATEAAAEVSIRWARYLEALESNEDVPLRWAAFYGALREAQYRWAVYHSVVADARVSQPRVA